MPAQTYFLKDKRGFITTIAGVYDRTFVDVIVYNKSNYRDVMDASYIGGTIANNIAGSPADPTDSISIVEQLQTLGGGGKGCDIVEHVAPHPEAVTRTEIRFWSGLAGTKVGSTNSTITLTVPSTEGLVIGQTVSGTGIVAGSTIASITAPTTITLSTAATATASGVTFTFGSGSLLGAIWEDEATSVSIATFTRV